MAPQPRHPRFVTGDLASRFWTFLKHSAFARPDDDLATFQEAVRLAVRRSAKRTLGGVVHYPTGVYVRASATDYQLWCSFRQEILDELDAELRQMVAEHDNIRYQGVRVQVSEDTSMQPGRPDVKVNFQQLTLQLPAPAMEGIITGRPWPADDPQPGQAADGGCRPGTSSARLPETLPATLPAGALPVRRGQRPDRSRPVGRLTLGADTYALPTREAGQLIIGRAPNAHVRIPAADRHASGVHAFVRPTNKGWVIVDNHSMNATLVDGQAISGPVALRDGMTLQIGDTQISVSIRVARSEPQGTVSR